jgi:hypothetical protein
MPVQASVWDIWQLRSVRQGMYDISDHDSHPVPGASVKQQDWQRWD